VISVYLAGTGANVSINDVQDAIKHNKSQTHELSVHLVLFSGQLLQSATCATPFGPSVPYVMDKIKLHFTLLTNKTHQNFKN